MNDVVFIAKKLAGKLTKTDMVWAALTKNPGVTTRQLVDRAKAQLPGNYRESHVCLVLNRLIDSDRATRIRKLTNDTKCQAWHYTAISK